jgi:hypothetical protein
VLSYQRALAELQRALPHAGVAPLPQLLAKPTLLFFDAAARAPAHEQQPRQEAASGSATGVDGCV